MAITMFIAVINIAWAAPDQYVNDAQGRQYLVPSEGQYQGQRMMELTTPSSNGTFGFTSAGSSSYHLNVSGGTDANCQNIQIWTDRHNFEIISAGGGWFRIKFATRYIDTDVTGGVKQGSNLWLYIYSTGDSEKDQTFKFKKNSDGTYTICSRHNENLVFDVENGTMANGTNVRLWTSNESAAQKWILTPTSGTYMLPDITPQTTVPDKYFVRYLIANGFASIYNHSSHTVTGKATLSANYDSNTGKAKAGANEHVVIVNPEQITELMGLGEYGDKTDERHTGVAKLTGIEYFTNLEKLDLCRADYGIKMKTHSTFKNGDFNLQYNTKLKYLDLDFANLTSFDNTGIASLENLEHLILNNNAFSSLDIRPFKKLQRLEMSHNYELMRIDADRNENMWEFAVFDNMYGYDPEYQLQTLIDKFPNLVFLHAFSTYTSDLDLSKHTKLQSVWLHKSKWAGIQKAKGNFLHHLDLSGCTELRDIHVHNMNIPALNIPSEHLGQPFSDEYKNLVVCREVVEGKTTVASHGDVMTPNVDVSNNYRTVKADCASWTKDGKIYYMYYLRTSLNEKGASMTQSQYENEKKTLLDNKVGSYKIFSYDKYDDRNSYKQTGYTSIKDGAGADETLGNDLFKGPNVTAAKTASVETNYNDLTAYGMLMHNDNGSTPLCMVHQGSDGTVSIANADKLPQEFVSNIGNIHGSAIILKAGVTTSQSDISPTGAPQYVGYDYNICSVEGKEYTRTFYLDVVYPDAGVITGIDEVDANKEVVSVKYYNVAGVESVIPFDGINIVVATYTDGTTSTAKVLK